MNRTRSGAGKKKSSAYCKPKQNRGKGECHLTKREAVKGTNEKHIGKNKRPWGRVGGAEGEPARTAQDISPLHKNTKYEILKKTPAAFFTGYVRVSCSLHVGETRSHTSCSLHVGETPSHTSNHTKTKQNKTPRHLRPLSFGAVYGSHT